MPEYAWMCLNKQDSEYAWGPKNMPKFWIWQGSQYASITQRSEYARICLERVLNISWVLNIPGFWIGQGSEYVRITQGATYDTTWLNISEYAWIRLNLQ